MYIHRYTIQTNDLGFDCCFALGLFGYEFGIANVELHTKMHKIQHLGIQHAIGLPGYLYVFLRVFFHRLLNHLFHTFSIPFSMGPWTCFSLAFCIACLAAPFSIGGVMETAIYIYI